MCFALFYAVTPHAPTIFRWQHGEFPFIYSAERRGEAY